MTKYDVIDYYGYTDEAWHFKTKTEAYNYAKLLSMDGNIYGIIKHTDFRMSDVIWV